MFTLPAPCCIRYTSYAERYLFKCVLCACVHICCQNMGDKLKKEHEELKAELKKLIKEHEVLQTKMADKLDRNFAPSHEDVQAINISCDELLASKKETQTALSNFNGKQDLLTKKVDTMTKEIDEATAYSYQYNIKIVGVPQIDRTESPKCASKCSTNSVST